MKISSLKLLIILFTFVSSAATHAQVGKLLQPKKVQRALKALQKRLSQEPSINGLDPYNRILSIPQLYKYNLLEMIEPSMRALTALTAGGYPAHQQAILQSLESDSDFAESPGNLVEEKLLSLCVDERPYLIDMATQIYRAKDLNPEMIISLLEELRVLGKETNRLSRQPNDWGILFERYQLIRNRVQGTSVESLFSDEAIEMTLAAAIAENRKRIPNIE